MRKALVVFLLVISGCAGYPPQGPSPQMVELQQYISTQRPRAESGEIKWSQYYDYLQKLYVDAQMPYEAFKVINRLYNDARLCEDGRMSQEEFQNRRQIARGVLEEIRQREVRSEQERQQANIALAAQIMQSRPLIPPLQFTPMTSAKPQAPTTQLQTFQPTATSVTAYWTGQQRQVQTVTYQSGWSCEYRYAAQTFWRTFVGTCPTTIQVQ
jgi:hypothetical protein